MPGFLSQHLEAFARELAFAPAQRRREHMDNAEQFFWQIDPNATYPLSHLVHQVTQFKPTRDDGTVLVGAAMRKDLLLLVENLSETLHDPVNVYDPAPLSLEDLQNKLGFTAKTISRYRRQGLFARRLLWPNGRVKLGFLPKSVERFLRSRSPRMRQAAGFSRIDRRTRQEIFQRARRLAERVDLSPFRAAQFLAAKYDRSIETIRLLLLKHDRKNPTDAIFPEHTPTLSDKQQRVIYRAFRRGIPVARLARRFDRARNAIYRVINLRRAQMLQDLNIRYIVIPTFGMTESLVDESDRIPKVTQTRTGSLPPVPSLLPTQAAPELSRNLEESPLLDAETETALFVRYNYLKYRAASLRTRIDPQQPRAWMLDRIETYLRRAIMVKEQIARANLRLVNSVARKYLHGRSGGAEALADRVAEGNLVLLETIETFDPRKENRFSTYLTWALRRRLYQLDQRQRSSGRQLSEPDGVSSGLAASNPELVAIEQSEHITHTLTRLLESLDERERFVVSRRFGLSDTGGQRHEPQTLAEVARELKVSAERTRQIERQALTQMRQRAGELGLEFSPQDFLPLG